MTRRRWAAACTAFLLFGVVAVVAGTAGPRDRDPQSAHEAVSPVSVFHDDAAATVADADRETTARSPRRRSSLGDDLRRLLDRFVLGAQLAVSLALLGTPVASRRTSSTRARSWGVRRDRAPPLLAAP